MIGSSARVPTMYSSGYNVSQSAILGMVKSFANTIIAENKFNLEQDSNVDMDKDKMDENGNEKQYLNVNDNSNNLNTNEMRITVVTLSPGALDTKIQHRLYQNRMKEIVNNGYVKSTSNKEEEKWNEN
eukprot:UN12945